MDAAAVRRARAIEVRVDGGLLESEAVLLASDGAEIASVRAARGSPERPLDEDALRQKLSDLGGDRLEGALDDPERPVAEVLELAGLRAFARG